VKVRHVEVPRGAEASYVRPVAFVQVQVTIRAPVDAVFRAVADHAQFLRDRRTTTTVVRAGTSERDGPGCLREVRVKGGLRFLEEVTAWESPRSFEYIIRESTLPVEHEGGRLTFTAAGGATEVVWTTRFRPKVPLVGSLVGAAAERIFARTFTRLLQTAKAKLEAAAA